MWWWSEIQLPKKILHDRKVFFLKIHSWESSHLSICCCFYFLSLFSLVSFYTSSCWVFPLFKPQVVWDRGGACLAAGAAGKVFITAELEPSPLTPADFTLAALPYLPRALPPLASAPCPSLWSCLAWLSTSPVCWPAATSLPSLPRAPPISPTPHTPPSTAILQAVVGGLRETAHRDWQYRMLIRRSAALPTIFLPDMSLCLFIDSIVIGRML